jgi:N utilization substance protein A
VRCKIVVDSTDSNVDPVGACVGQRGVRIQNITDEVNGERIDVIEYSEDFETMLKEVLSPAKLDHFVKHDDEKRVEVYVAEDQRALAIGKSGQNVRLAGEILGWDIDILNTAELSGEVEVDEKEESKIKNEENGDEQDSKKADTKKDSEKSEEKKDSDEKVVEEKVEKDAKKAEKEEKKSDSKKEKTEEKKDSEKVVDEKDSAEKIVEEKVEKADEKDSKKPEKVDEKKDDSEKAEK